MAKSIYQLSISVETLRVLQQCPTQQSFNTVVIITSSTAATTVRQFSVSSAITITGFLRRQYFSKPSICFLGNIKSPP